MPKYKTLENKEDKSSKAMMTGMVSMVMVMIGFTLVMGFLPAEAAPPVTYTCPICSEEFATEQELIDHFGTEHPSEPIDIIWE